MNQKNNIKNKSPDSDFLRDLCMYLRDFLDTDFKKERKPKRKLSRKDKESRLTGILLKRYPKFISNLWGKLDKPVNGGMSISISKNKYTIPLDRGLSDLVNKTINNIKSEGLNELRLKLISKTKLEIVNVKAGESERFIQKILKLIENTLKSRVVTPFLVNINKNIGNEALKEWDDVFNADEEIVTNIIGYAEEIIVSSLNIAIVGDGFKDYESIMGDIFSDENIKSKLYQYFEGFNAFDLYSELLELLNTVKQKNNFQIYLYIGEIGYEKNKYPLIYIPLTLTRKEHSILIEGVPHLYINKKAIDYVAQMVANKDKISSIVKERIVYMQPENCITDISQKLINDWSHELSINPLINLNNKQPQLSRSELTTATNALNIAVFEKSEEALLNDYEALLDLAKSESDIFKDYAEIVRSFLYEEPQSFLLDIEDDWIDAPMEDRLVYESPVPLNEEQRKILNAIQKSECRFISVQGPPGTGKSHTITAVVFEAILKGQSVLVLSDKVEALDVVEDKLTAALNKVRHDDNFQNPLLRLGKSSNTYNKILAGASITQIKQNYLAARQKESALKAEISNKKISLSKMLALSKERAHEINLSDVVKFNKNENKIIGLVPEVEKFVDDNDFFDIFESIKLLRESLTSDSSGFLSLVTDSYSKLNLATLNDLVDLQSLVNSLRVNSGFSIDGFNVFTEFSENMVDVLAGFIRRYKDAKWPIFGYFFIESKVRVIDAEFGKEFKCISSTDMHKRIVELDRVILNFYKLSEVLVKSAKYKYFGFVFLQLLSGVNMDNKEALKLKKLISKVSGSIEKYSEFYDVLDINKNNVTQWIVIDKNKDKRFYILFYYFKESLRLNHAFMALPEIDYTGDKSELELLHTRKLANIIDERVVNFVENHRTLAITLKKIIKNKQQFPKNEFINIKEAFPCIIANIRDYAEYVPLEKELFDMVIIDEASQVSIAQAFPAIIRAKKTIVLGDLHQFSNVKTSQASNAINNKYLNVIQQNFKKLHGSDSIDNNVLARLDHFNIKTSILTFVDAMANYTTMLRKHFRGYPDLISFSSKYFYESQLQAVKLRGKSIDEVLQFVQVAEDEKLSIKGNVNELEYIAIEKELLSLLEQDKPMSVGIITPFRDQQAYISKQLDHHVNSSDFDAKLKLKVMTFDSCQGEERDIIMYSMVATKSVDKLSYIFSKNIHEAGDVEDVLRLQRLNVGFSRAKEKIQFFISKPVIEFRGAIGEALRHYDHILNTRNLPEASQLDSKSPMEEKLLHWFKQTEFYALYQGKIELLPQFPIGDYLRQLDPDYQHPAYRVDFLLRVRDVDNIYNIIIEYDGFKEYFTHLEMENQDNYIEYYKADDIEREKILEGYGYHMIRVNRFNLGKDPVKTLSSKLIKHVKRLRIVDVPNAVLEGVNKLSASLQNGESKVCSKCKNIRPISAFVNTALKSGIAKHCEVCRAKR